MRETESEWARLHDEEPGWSRHTPDELASHRVDGAYAIADADQWLAISVDQAEALQVLEVKDEIEAKGWRVARAEHAEVVGPCAGLDLDRNADGFVLSPSTLGHAVVVTIDERRLLEVSVEPRLAGERTWIDAMELAGEGIDQSPARHGAPRLIGRE